MKTSTKTKYGLQTLLAALFWLAVWQAASLLIGQVLFLPSPLDAARALAEMAPAALFWQAVGASLWRIMLGFFLGLGAGVLLAALAAAFAFAEILIRPLMLLVRSTPVASFIILALLWVDSRGLSTFISFLMVLPVIYNATFAGLRGADAKLLEMAGAFRIGFWRRVRAIYLPALLPSLLASCELALGMSWKSGVAAEVIGLPAGTIGERLYQAKIFLQTPALFAWTAVIIALSGLLGKLVLLSLSAGARRLAGGRASRIWAEGWLAKQTPRARHTESGAHSANGSRCAGEPSLTGGARRGARQRPPLPPRDIRLADICKSYGGRPVLRDFSAFLPAGGDVALMGPSGSGKTTLVRVIMGLEKADGGELGGAAGQHFDCVFQEDRLCEDFSALYNVALVLPRSGGRAEAALAALGIAGADARKPVAQLSGGERRRVAIARAVAAPGAVLVLDEAFKGLDAAAREAAFEYIRQNRAGRSLLIVTHDAAEAEAFGAGVVKVPLNAVMKDDG